MKQPAFSRYDAGEILPGKHADIDSFIAMNAASAYHPSCTCKMGPVSDKFAVVNPHDLSVYGVNGLHVVDASIMPSIISGNLNGTVIMMAEKAADVLSQNKTVCGRRSVE